MTNTKDNKNRPQLVPFADDASLIITSSNPTNFVQDISVAFTNINNLFNVNLLPMNFEKTNFIQFLTKSSSHIPFSVYCDINIKFNITNIKFLGIMSDNTLTWKSHIEMIIQKLSVACFVVRAIKHFVTQYTLKMVCYSYFHWHGNYGLFHWDDCCFISES
jgi:hypothetical protein